jgi:hypothetical protein
MNGVLRVLQILTFPPALPLTSVIYDDAAVLALVAMTAGPLLFGTTCVFMILTAVMTERCPPRRPASRR